jgi:peroxiredoxin
LVLRSPSGEQVSLIPYLARKAVVVVFWAAWCPICRDEASRINELNTNANVKVIAVNEGDNPRQIAAFIAAHKVDYQVVIDPVSEVANAFGVPGMPYCVIIGRSGVIVYRGYKLPEDVDYYIR